MKCNFYDILWQFWNSVDRLPIIGCIWNAEWECKLVTLNQLIFEVVPFNHSKVLHWLVANGESQAGSNRFQLEELGSEMVPNSSSLILLFFCQLL